jgi:hypothetical protein
MATNKTLCPIYGAGIGGWWRFGPRVILCLTLPRKICDDRYDVWTKDFRMGRIGESGLGRCTGSVSK